MSRVVDLAVRVGRRVRRAMPTRTPAPRQRLWDAEVAAEFEDLAAEYRLAFQTMSSATVASWEVAASELHRRLKPRLGAEEAAARIERFSDALVPALAVFQGTERGVGELWPKVVEAGREHGTVARALAVVAAHVRALGAGFEREWPKSVEYLGPVLDGVDMALGDRQRLLAVGVAVRRGLDGRAEAFAKALAGVAVSADITRDFLEAVDGYRHGSGREVELALHEVEQLVVRAAGGAE